MTPGIIHRIVSREFSELVAETRASPDGWAYFLGTKQGGTRSNRIFRAVASNPKSDAKLKLSVSSRLGQKSDFVFSGSERELIDLVSNEIRLYRQNF